MAKFHTLYDHPASEAAQTGGPSLTQQEFAQDADINRIVSRFGIAGLSIEDLNAEVGGLPFGDASGIPDLGSVLGKIAGAKEQFEFLPAKVKERFGNRVDVLLNFLADPANKEEAEKLGLLGTRSLDVSVPTDTDDTSSGGSNKKKKKEGEEE